LKDLEAVPGAEGDVEPPKAPFKDFEPFQINVAPDESEE
jgi:hypothetical protein